MKPLFFTALLGVALSACGSGPLNDKACANHLNDPKPFCGEGRHCQIEGELSRCVADDNGVASDSAVDTSFAEASGDAGALRDGPSIDKAVSAEQDASVDLGSPSADTQALGDGKPDRASTIDVGPPDVGAADMSPPDMTPPPPTCGDGIKNGKEECDLGTTMNTGAYGGCTSACKLAPWCGDGTKNGPEECDQGSMNSATAYGQGKCTDECKKAPYCGDGARTGSEKCDPGTSASTALGACNPECSGFYEKKYIRTTLNKYSTNLGGVAGADNICVTEFGGGWKALIVGGTRRATKSPLLGDEPQDWVIRKYTQYFNAFEQLIWVTDAVPLLGVRDGQRTNIYAIAYDTLAGTYAWSGYASDWTTMADATCSGWTLDSMPGNPNRASFCGDDLAHLNYEPCGRAGFVLCVQQ